MRRSSLLFKNFLFVGIAFILASVLAGLLRQKGVEKISYESLFLNADEARADALSLSCGGGCSSASGGACCGSSSGGSCACSCGMGEN